MRKPAAWRRAGPRGGLRRRGAVVLLLALAVQGAAERKPLVPAMFVFGDSLVDVGNNHHLPRCNASCRANYPRYGVDLPGHSPTGRFSNGYNLADRLGICVTGGNWHGSMKM